MTDHGEAQESLSSLVALLLESFLPQYRRLVGVGLDIQTMHPLVTRWFSGDSEGASRGDREEPRCIQAIQVYACSP